MRFSFEKNIVFSCLSLGFFILSSSCLSNSLFVIGVLFMIMSINIPIMVFPLLAIMKESFVLMPSFTVMKVVGMVFVFLFTIHIMVRFRDIYFKKIILLYWAILAYILASLVFNNFIDLTEIIGRIVMVFTTCLFYLFLSNKTSKQLVVFLKNYINALNIGLFLISTYTMFFFNRIISNDVISRIAIKDSEPNEFAIIVGVLSIVSLYFYLKSNGLYKYFSLITYILCALNVFLTLSRSGFFVFVIVSVLTFLCNTKRIFEKIKILCLGLVILLAISTFFVDSITMLITRLFTANDANEYFSSRLEIWSIVLRLISSRFFLGWGGGAKYQEFLMYRETGWAIEVHNMYLQFLVEYGVFGLLLFAALIYNCFLGYKRVSKIINNNILLIPYFMLFGLLLGGFSLTWAFREIIWFQISLCLAIKSIEPAVPPFYT